MTRRNTKAPPNAKRDRRDGAAFEQRVHEALDTAIRSRAFGLEPSKCQVTLRPRYYSRDRGSDIVFDLGVELRLALDASPFLTIVVECKNYASSVPVDDLEEFKAKLDQCFGKNVKGMFVSSGALQPAAVSYAVSNGIGVARLLPGDVIEFTNYLIMGGDQDEHAALLRQEREDEVDEALTVSDFPVKSCEFGHFDFFAAHGGDGFVDMAELIAVMSGLTTRNRWDFTEFVSDLDSDSDKVRQ